MSLWSLSTCVQILLLQQLQKMLLQVLLLIYNLLPSTIHTIHQVFNFNFNNWLFEELNHTPSWCSRVCRVQMRTLAGVSSLESAITLQLSRGLDSPTLHQSIGKSQIFISPSMISKWQRVGHRPIFCLWEISAMRLVSVSPGQWLGGGVGCCSAALCVDMTSIFIFIDSIQRKRKSFSFMYWTLLDLIGP